MPGAHRKKTVGAPTAKGGKKKPTPKSKATTSRTNPPIPIDNVDRFSALPSDLRLMVYRFAFADFRAEFGQHGNEEVESFPAKDKASGKQECLLLLFPAKKLSKGHRKSTAMKKRWLLLGQLSHQLRAEHHPFITTKTRVFLSMDRTIAIHFFEIFFPKGGEPSLFSHVKFIFNASASNNAAKVNILPLIKLLHSAPDLKHSITSRNESGSTCNHAILDMLFAPQNSLREHIIAHNVQFTRTIYSPSYLEVHVRSEFAKPWMPVDVGILASGYALLKLI